MIRRGFTLIELLVVITIIGILVSLALPNFIKAKDKALEVQTKSSVHAIQISLERYATDQDGLYPNYIYGGDVASWTNGQGWAALATAQPMDPLIFYGYQTSYHRNPFMKDGSSLCIRTNLDPRFGCWWRAGLPPRPQGGDLLGNILSDPNYPGRDTNNCNTQTSQCGTLSPLPSDNPLATGQQQVIYYFMGDDNTQTVDWIPGEFAYRAYGVTPGIIRQLGTTGGIMRPFSIDHFLLAGYGSVRTVGKDVLHCWGTRNPNGGLNGLPTEFGTLSGTVVDRFGCRQNPNAFIPGSIWLNEPGYGGVSSQGTLLGVAEIPNVAFVPAPGVARATDVSTPNQDGRYDGVVVYYSAGTEQATGGTVEQ